MGLVFPEESEELLVVFRGHVELGDEPLSKIKTVVEELAKAQKLQLVLHGDQAVVWTEPGLDLTAAVIERLNASPPATPKP